MTKRVAVKYELGHTIRSRWEEDEDEYCPFCGSRGIWTRLDGGDIDIGASKSVCVSCRSSYYLVSSGQDDGILNQIVRQLSDRPEGGHSRFPVQVGTDS